MRNLTAFETQIISLLNQHGTLKGPQLASLLGVPHKEVGRIIGHLRKMFTSGNQNAVYIHLSKRGYTLEETPDNLKYEGLRRLKMGTSIILNGKHVFNRYKAISLSDYHRIQIEFQPKSLKTINVLSDTPDTARLGLRVRRLPNNGVV